MSNRHICIPKATLLRFAKNGSLRYLNLGTGEIRSSSPNSFMTADDYYSPEVEKLLADKVESIMGRLYKKVEDARREKEILSETVQDLSNLAKEIVFVQSMRNPSYVIKKVLPYAPSLPQGEDGAKTLANSILTQATYDYFCNMFCTTIGFNSYRAMTVINDTDRAFILPTMHHYQFKVPDEARDRKNWFVIVMDPKLAWVLIDENDYNRDYRDGSGEVFLRVTQPELVEAMNYVAVAFERECGAGRIVSTFEELQYFIGRNP